MRSLILRITFAAGLILPSLAPATPAGAAEGAGTAEGTGMRAVADSVGDDVVLVIPEWVNKPINIEVTIGGGCCRRPRNPVSAHAGHWGTVGDSKPENTGVIYEESCVLTVDPDPADRAQASFPVVVAGPNPFSTTTEIRYEAPMEGEVKLAFYDVSGRVLRRLVRQTVRPGLQTIVWDGRDGAGRRVSRGVYYYRLAADGWSRTGRLVRVD
jgi:hypothetical protein